MADKTLGQAAYEAYWKAEGVAATVIDGGWRVLNPQARAAWEAAAAAAVEACGGSDG